MEPGDGAVLAVKRTATRFVLVLLVGGGLLYFFSRGEKPLRSNESPSIVTGRLGDVGAPVPRSGGRRLRVTPVRNVVIRQLAALKDPNGKPADPGTGANTDGPDATLYQSITELHGSAAEYRADETQVITDALFVRELDETSTLPAAERRTLFQEVLAYEPGEIEPPAVDDPESDADATKRKITHVRIAAGRAEIVARKNESPRIRFYGDPPDGVQITAFDEQARPVLEFRTEFLLARQNDRDENVEFALSSPKRVHFYSPDGRYRLSGIGLRGHFVRPRERKDDGTSPPSSGIFVLDREIRLEAPMGLVMAKEPDTDEDETDGRDANPPSTTKDPNKAKNARKPKKPAQPKKKTNRVYRNEGVITCAGPARFRVQRPDEKRREADGADSSPAVFDYLELNNRVHAHHESTTLEDGVAVAYAVQDLDAERLEIRLENRELDSIVARHHVNAKVVYHTPLRPSGDRVDLGTSQMQETTLRCHRARVAFKSRTPKWIRAYAWSTVTCCIGGDQFGRFYAGAPIYSPPQIDGRVRAKNLDEGRFRATCRREILVQRKPRHGTGRLTLFDDVKLDFEGAGRRGEDDPEKAKKKRKKKGPETPSWLPGFSGLEARDRVVIDHFDRPHRLLDFLADGDVRIETVMGKMTAQRVTGTVVNTDRWRVEADGDPVLDLPISSRSSDRFGRILRDLTLDRGGPAPRASETAGRVRIEGRRAVFEMDRTQVVAKAADEATAKKSDPEKADQPKKADEEQRMMRGAARFAEAVRVTQLEASSAPIRLFCRDLRFGFDEVPGTDETGKRRTATSEIVADGDVVIDGGPGVRASGDRLTFDRRASDERSGTLVGYPARLRLVDRHKRRAILEGRTITLDSTNRRAMARTGAFARFHPSRDSRFSIPGAETGSITIDAVEIDADRAEISWGERQSLSAFRAFDSVRMRGFDQASGSDTGGRLLQWAEADQLHYELAEAPTVESSSESSSTDERSTAAPGAAATPDSPDTPAKPTAAAKQSDRRARILKLIGQEEQPVRMGYRDPTREGADDDYRLEVPMLVVRNGAKADAPDEVTGYGAGRIHLLSQDNVFGTKSGDAKRSEVIDLRFRNGFTMHRVDDNRSRLDFPGGGELISTTGDGKQVAHLEASKTLSLRLNTAKRKEGEDLRVIDSGYAEGDVKIRYRNDTTGGADAVTWRRGTNTVIMDGKPAWIDQPGQRSKATGRRITYNMATRRVRIADFAGQLRRQFEGKEKTP